MPAKDSELNQYGITETEYSALKLLSKIEDQSYQFTQDEKRFLSNFITGSFGDMALNERLDKSSLGSMSAMETGVNTMANQAIKDLTFRTRHISEFDAIFNKATEAYNNVTKGIQPSDDSKISLREYSILRDLATLKTRFDALNKKGIFENNRNLQILYEKVQRADAIVKHLDAEFKTQFKFGAGAIIFDHAKKRAEVTGRVMDFFSKTMSAVVTEYGHVAKGYESDQEKIKNQTMKSHIDPTYKEEPFSLRDFLYSDVYVIKLDQLISAENKAILQKAYGDDWLKNLNLKYQQLEREMHDNQRGRHQHISAAEQSKQISVGVSSLLPFGIGHKKVPKDSSSSFKKIRWEQQGNVDNVKMLCSEFIARTTIATLEKLNVGLKADLKDKGFEINDNIVRNPIPKSEKISNLHPQRFLEVLKQAKCVERIETPAVVNQFIQRR